MSGDYQSATDYIVHPIAKEVMFGFLKGLGLEERYFYCLFDGLLRPRLVELPVPEREKDEESILIYGVPFRNLNRFDKGTINTTKQVLTSCGALMGDVGTKIILTVMTKTVDVMVHRDKAP